MRTTDGFSQLDLPLDKALDRIRIEWAALERELWPGDVFWLANTSAGDALAEKVLRDREMHRDPSM